MTTLVFEFRMLPFSLTFICDVRKDSEKTTDPKHPLPVSRSGMSNTIREAYSNQIVGQKEKAELETFELKKQDPNVLKTL